MAVVGDDTLIALQNLESSPLASLEVLLESLPASAHAVLREAARVRKLTVGSGTVAEAASRLLELAGHHRYECRGRVVEYWELPDAESDLLYGNVLWPCAEVLTRLLLEAEDGVSGCWDDARCRSVGVPLEQLVERRFGLTLRRPPPGEADDAPPLPSLSGATVLEIGCGVGLCGLFCGMAGAQVTLSDGEARLVESLRVRHGHHPHLTFELLDWREPSPADAQRFDVVLGSDVLHPRCEGELHAPRLISERLARTPHARALLISEVRRLGTCRTAVDELRRLGLRVSTFHVWMGHEFFPAALDAAPIGSKILIAAR